MSSRSTTTSGPRIETSDERGGDIPNMLDPKATRNIQVAQNHDNSAFSDDDTEAMEFDDSGKLVVGGDDEINFKDSDDNDDYDANIPKEAQESQDQ